MKRFAFSAIRPRTQGQHPRGHINVDSEDNATIMSALISLHPNQGEGEGEREGTGTGKRILCRHRFPLNG
ncbi:hypothetical protein PAMA_012751 [Pampus argenteus]